MSQEHDERGKTVVKEQIAKLRALGTKDADRTANVLEQKLFLLETLSPIERLSADAHVELFHYL